MHSKQQKTIKRGEKLFCYCVRHRLNPLISYFLKAYSSVNSLCKPIFVVGLNRSGTSVTTNLFAKTDELLNWSEANEIWDPLGYPFETSKLERPFWPLNPEGYTKSVLDSHPHHYCTSIPGIFSLYLSTYGKRGQTRFVNKSPMNSTRISFLCQLFPDAYYLSIVRDPRAVVRSWIFKIIPKLQSHSSSNVYFDDTGKLKSVQINSAMYDREELITRMAASYNYVVGKQLKDLKLLPSESVFFMRYEDFVKSPRSIIQRIDSKFGLDPSKRDFEGIPEKLENRNSKYQYDLSIKEVSLISSICHSLIKDLGYDA